MADPPPLKSAHMLGDPSDSRNDYRVIAKLDKEIWKQMRPHRLAVPSVAGPMAPKLGYLPQERLETLPVLERLYKKLAALPRENRPERRFRGMLAKYRYLQQYRDRFEGNANYLRLFNNEAHKFFNIADRSTTVVRGFNHPLFFPEIGSVWTSRERDLFYELLARYSIHRVDVICEQLPTKSRVEVLAFYKTMRQEVALRKKSGEEELLAMSEMPIAYEMDEEWVRMEESQAELLATPLTIEDIIADKDLEGLNPGEYEDLIDFGALSRVTTAVTPDTPVPRELTVFIKDLVVDLVRELLSNIVERRVGQIPAKTIVERQRISVSIERDEVVREAYDLLGPRMFRRSEFDDPWKVRMHAPQKAVPRSTQDLDVLETVLMRPARKKRRLETAGPPSTVYNEAVAAAVSFDELETRPSHEQPQQLNELDDCKVFMMETSLLEQLDHQESVKYERMLLGMLLIHSDDLELNDPDLSAYTALNRSMPERLPFFYHSDLRFMRIYEEKQAKLKDKWAKAAWDRRQIALKEMERIQKKRRVNSRYRGKGIFKQLTRDWVRESNILDWFAIKSLRKLKKTHFFPIGVDETTGEVTWANWDDVEDHNKAVVFPDVSDELVYDYNCQYAQYEEEEEEEEDTN